MENKKTEGVATTATQESKKVVETLPKWAQAMQDELANLKEENEMLKDLAGKNTIASYKDSKKPEEVKTAYLKLWNDKMVIAWEKLDYSHFNPKAPDGLTENILVPLILEDGTKETVNYISFNNSIERVDLEIDSQKGDMTTVILPNGKKLTLETKFLNR